ncbi:MAG: hypothetical protein PHT54_01345 [Candidatus Nanoarchaeia archaeon]|nr:hypothetical protein [Candidatus Nanoarchaeia archaeon]
MFKSLKSIVDSSLDWNVQGNFLTEVKERNDYGNYYRGILENVHYLRGKDRGEGKLIFEIKHRHHPIIKDISDGLYIGDIRHDPYRLFFEKGLKVFLKGNIRGSICNVEDLWAEESYSKLNNPPKRNLLDYIHQNHQLKGKFLRGVVDSHYPCSNYWGILTDVVDMDSEMNGTGRVLFQISRRIHTNDRLLYNQLFNSGDIILINAYFNKNMLWFVNDFKVIGQAQENIVSHSYLKKEILTPKPSPQLPKENVRQQTLWERPNRNLIYLPKKP